MGMRFVETIPTGDRSPFADSVDRWAYFIFFLAVAVTALGSAYYHLRPNDDALVWDRLPMAVGFLSLLAAVVCERTTPKNGLRYLMILPIWGAGTVLYWRATEQSGQGDLRPYVIAQFGSLLAILLLMAFFVHDSPAALTYLFPWGFMRERKPSKLEIAPYFRRAES